MPVIYSACAWVLAAYEHVLATGHEAIEADDPLNRQLGISCSDCGSDPNTVWMWPLVAGVEVRTNHNHPLRELILTSTTRNILVEIININAVNPMGISMNHAAGLQDLASIPPDFWDRVRAFEAGQEVEPVHIERGPHPEPQGLAAYAPEERERLQALWPIPEESEGLRQAQAERQTQESRRAETARLEASRASRFDRNPVRK